MALPATASQLDELRPYFAGEASPSGEVDTYCPVHPDENRSAQTNIKKGVFFCNACGAGMTINRLVEEREYWFPINGRNGAGRSKVDVSDLDMKASEDAETVTWAEIHRWHNSLMKDEDGSGTALHNSKGISRNIAIRFDLGWDGKRRVFTIPIRSLRGKLWNVRRYSLSNQDADRRKIWGLRGRNEPRLFPASALVPWDEPIIICEGEWDALLTIQNGFRAITRTGTADAWRKSWNQYFANRDVFICHDRDRKGTAGNKRVRQELKNIASSVRQIVLPYPYKAKHGFDLGDFWLDDNPKYRFEELMEEAI